MKLLTGKKIPPLKSNDTIVAFASEDELTHFVANLPSEILHIKEFFDFTRFTAKFGETLYIPVKSHPSVILCGLGKSNDINAEILRNTASLIVAECQKRKIANFHCLIPKLQHLTPQNTFKSLAEGFCLSDYSFTRYRTTKENEFRIEKAILHETSEYAETVAHEVEITCRCTLQCRDIVNESSDRCTPKDFAEEAKKISHAYGLRCTIMDEKEIERLGMGLIFAVGRGSPNPPRLVILRYKGNPKSAKTIAFVGKGITFDSGGINLKSTGNIESMRSDMAGAAVCLYTIKAAAELSIKQNVIAAMALAENMPSASSYRPGDVYRAFNGKTVEIGNTDAEGRLVLADALAYVGQHFKPETIIDIATLTGACIISLGESVAGLMTPDDELARAIFDAGETTGERVWRLPLVKEYEEDLKSDFADFINTPGNRKAGAIMGGLFLKNFVENKRWAHLDIAGPSWFSKKRGYRPKNATGFGVRLFVEFLKKYSL
ncbi:MAG: leucyl aminopeptidase [Spirochaetes bacterium]|nr:leucyl aminopeptidase [Spirochaetota bacterium]